MTTRRSGLGRGLESLIPQEQPGYQQVSIDLVDPNPDQPRTSFEETSLSSLAASIAEVGVLQPLVVRSTEAGRFVLIAGERRLRASRLAGLTLVPIIVRDPSDSGSLTEALIENLQREDLSPLEEAAAYQQLLERFEMTHQEVGERVGRSRAAISNTVRLLQLDPHLQGLLESGKLTAGHARALLAVEDTAYAVHIGDRAAAEGWSVRQVEDAVRLRKSDGVPISGSPGPAETPPRPAAIVELEQRLAERLEAPVDINYRGKGGRLVISFNSLDDLERIYRVFYG